MVAHTDPSTLKGLRDGASLFFGFAPALRRSELVALSRSRVFSLSPSVYPPCGLPPGSLVLRWGLL
jgi:hypothetical protein